MRDIYVIQWYISLIDLFFMETYSHAELRIDSRMDKEFTAAYERA